MSFVPLSLSHTHKRMYDVCSTAGSVLIRIWASCQVAVGPLIFIGPIGGAAVVFLSGRGAVFFVGAELYVTAVVFRHLCSVKICLCEYEQPCLLVLRKFQF